MNNSTEQQLENLYRFAEIERGVELSLDREPIVPSREIIVRMIDIQPNATKGRYLKSYNSNNAKIKVEIDGINYG